MTNNEGIIFVNCPNCGESIEINSQQIEEVCPVCKNPLDIQTLAVAESQPTRKDKIKELLGRNLNSYHTKAKQLLTDIEKKNKEQNHKISVLTNKLDNDYLTKTEEGSVMSLDYSKEGMVYLDELQGNTMVNYCTDGSKELTLNGDIDVEGTFVTTTEGVDNGLIDVMCEGNTLVNLANHNDLRYPTKYSYLDNGYITYKSDGVNYMDYIYLNINQFKPSTTYTIILDIKSNTFNKEITLITNNETIISSYQNPLPAKTTGVKTIKFTTRSDFSNATYGVFINGGSTDGTGNIVFRTVILEGDWTNKEIPPYFEGMKSVGQDDANGHKIEILSSNNVNGNKYYFETDKIVLPNGTRNILSNNDYTVKIGKVVIDGTQNFTDHSIHGSVNTYRYSVSIPNINVNTSNNQNSLGDTLDWKFDDSDTVHYKIGVAPNTVFLYIPIEYRGKPNEYFAKNPFTLYYEYTNPINIKLNKKEILLNEPLRSLPKVAKDNLIKLNNDWFVERKCGGALFNGEEVWNVFNANTIEEESCVFYTANKISNCVMNTVVDGGLSLISNTFKCSQTNSTGTIECIQIYDNKLRVKLLKSKLNTVDVEGFKKWLADNPLEIVYQLATSTYEPLEIEPTLNTYNDVTHISNNSIIPCTMKVKNSGYNAIIKPSTLYTIALDTNRTGTIGCNLGGTKGTTTNNVLTLTTPAILADDSLRIYGKGIKGIKGSKIRLLEGDRTNWIPSFFEGMKSSFEDKVQSDGTYKMEILSNNNNLFNFADFIDKLNSNDDIYLRKESNTSLRVKSKNPKDWTSFYDGIFKFEPNTIYTFIMDEVTKIQEGALETSSWYGRLGMISFYNGLTKNTLIGEVHSDKRVLKFKTDRTGLVRILFRCNVGNMDNTKNGNEFILNNIRILKQEDLDISNKSNKIQFSSVEPLRGIGNIKDRFIFKDDKLVIERNIGQRTYNGTEGWSLYSNKDKVYWISIDEPNGARGDIIINRNCYTNKFRRVESVTFDEEGWGWGDNSPRFYISLSKFKLPEISTNGVKQVLQEWYREGSPLTVTYVKAEPTYEEIPYEFQKIILEGYENGTLFFDTNIPPTATVTYAGEAPIVSAVKSTRTNVLSNTDDINDNIVPYLMDMDYRVVCLQLAENTESISVARLLGGTYEMLQRDIQSKRYPVDEYKHRLDAYLEVKKITEEEYIKLGEMLNE